MRIGATLTGAADLEKRLLEMPSAVAFKVQSAALVAGAEPIRAEAALRAPRDEKAGAPHMADNIIIDALKEGEIERSLDFKPGQAVVEVGPSLNHWYGHYSEYGTAREPARPWFRPAFDAKASQSLNITMSRLWQSIRAVAKSGGAGTLSLPSNLGTVGSRNL